MTGKFDLAVAVANGWSYYVGHNLATTELIPSTVSRSQWPELPSTSVYRIELGHIDRQDDPLGVEVTRDIASWVEAFEGHLETGALKPLDYHVFDGVGWPGLIDAIAFYESGKSTSKLVVKVQDP